MADDSSGGPPFGPTDEFARRLDELKATGSAMLVVGEVSPEVYADVCRRMLGDPDGPDRRRLLVFTNGTFAPGSRLPGSGEPEPDTTKVVTAAATRSVAEGDGLPSTVPVETLGDASLSELGIAISAAIERFENTYGPLEPATLRVGLDSLSSLLDAHDEQAVFRFVALTVARVKSVDGMAHFHLPVERGSYAARLLAPLFDAIVEVRVQDGRSQQRWHLREERITSQWLSL